MAHVQGGEVTGSIDEKVRHAVTKLSNFHFVANRKAAERVIRMGEDENLVFVTGCPSIDLAARIMSENHDGYDPFEKYTGTGSKFDPKLGYLVVLQHPVTTEYEHSLFQIQETLAAIVSLAYPTFWFWPNVDAGSDYVSKGIRQFREAHNVPFLHFFKNLSPEDFLRLLVNSKCLIGNSSVGIRETSYLGVPVVNIGNRQIGRDRGTNVTDVGYDRNAIIKAVREKIDNCFYPSSNLYGDGHA